MQSCSHFTLGPVDPRQGGQIASPIAGPPRGQGTFPGPGQADELGDQQALSLLQLGTCSPSGAGTHNQHPASGYSKHAVINNSAQMETHSQTCIGWQAANDTMVQKGTPTAIKHKRQQTPPSIFWTHNLTLAINHLR